MGSRECCWLSGAVFLILVHLSVQMELCSLCLKAERDALFKFKKSIIRDEGNLLSSWKGDDCCCWNRVTCNNVTGHVEKLHLQAPYIGFEAEKLDPSLVELRQLTYLDLSNNDFQWSSIPPFIGSMKHLNYLNLTRARFSGIVPHSLGNLTGLKFLDLSWNFVYSWSDDDEFQVLKLSVDDPHWVYSLTKLEYIGMSSINFTHPRDSLQALTSLPCLSELHLAECQLGNNDLSHSLFSNSNIQHLDLSGNYLEGTSLDLFPNMTSLISLDLSSNNLSIPIPFWLLNKLPSLLDLDLRRCGLDISDSSQASISNSTWLSTIHNIDLSFNNLKGPLLNLFANMSSLISLDLSYNQLTGPIPLWLRNLENLESLSLGFNSFSGVEGGDIMGIIGKLCKLKHLDFSYNQIEADILGFPNNLSEACTTYDLEALNFRGNRITGTVPYSLWKEFRFLRSLDLSDNRLFGDIPKSLGNLSSLECLDLSDNSLNGTIPSSLGLLPSLERLYLADNFLNDSIPSCQGRFFSLESLDLSNNRLTGKVPESLGQCTKLTNIVLSSNLLQGVVTHHHFANLSNLYRLDLSFNSLMTLNFSSNWKPPFQLISLSLSYCKIKGQIPQWIQTQTQLFDLDLSNCEISGKMPDWYWHKNLESFNLSSNFITGPITSFSSDIFSIDLSNNLLSGPIPQDHHRSNSSFASYSLCNLPLLSFLSLHNNSLSGMIPDCLHSSEGLNVINLSMNNFSGLIPLTLKSCTSLVILDMGENKLSGEIPSFGENNNPFLQILRLRANKLSGVIPQQLCSLPNLQILDLASNNLSGNIPRCLGHLNHMELLHSTPPAPVSAVLAPASGPTSQTPLADEPTYFGGESAIEVLKGQELQYTRTLKLVVNLDLSCNGLVGYIPEELISLSGLIGLNLSYNHLTGNIPEKIGEMSSIESLDLSNNNLSGTIPASMAALHFLSYLNMSYNKLHGRIPTGSQLQVLNDPSAYIGNQGLCGDPLPDKCFKDHNHKKQEKEGKEEVDKNEDMREKVLFYMVVMLGVATGFWGVVGVLLWKKPWRYALFEFVEDSIDYLVVKMNKLKKKRK